MADDRLGRLRGVKLQALARDHLGRRLDAEPAPFPPGAALVEGDEAWVLLEDDPERGLGPALAWARRAGAGAVNVLAESGTGLLARRARGFRLPVTVWHVEGRELVPAVAEPLPRPAAPSPAHLGFVDTIAAAGARPVVEHGVVTGEVHGLEVCRVVDDADTGAVRLEVGVGVHDREAFAVVHGDVPTADALARVVAAVAEHRRPGAVDHPLSRLAPERLLRWALEQDPGAVGLASLVPIAGPVARRNVKERAPCTALGHRPDGAPVVVVCSVGVDLDVVPYALDARRVPGVEVGEGLVGDGDEAAAGGVAEAWIVAPPRDLVPVTVELAGLAAQPLSLVPWSAPSTPSA